MKKIGVCLVCTGKYGIFLQPLIDSIEKYFFTESKIVIYLFTDKQHDINVSSRIDVILIPTPHVPFPYATLYRFKYFNGAACFIDCDYLFYLDVDMKVVDYVGEEILPNAEEKLTATRHPGFVNGGWGSNNVDKRSTAFIPEELRKTYFAGGFQGGETTAYLQACKTLSDNISKDEDIGIIAEWHDESHWNSYLSTRTPKIISNEYCMCEKNISGNPKIIALDKNHAELRS